MTKTLFASAALLLATVAPALADEKPTEISFQRDGGTYVYTMTEKAGSVILNGRFPTGDRFELIVRGNHVTGIVDGKYVSFNMPRARAKSEAAAELAIR
jgi:phosphate-selective porin